MFDNVLQEANPLKIKGDFTTSVTGLLILFAIFLKAKTFFASIEFQT